jgi:hypothetical protein
MKLKRRNKLKLRSPNTCPLFWPYLEHTDSVLPPVHGHGKLRELSTTLILLPTAEKDHKYAVLGNKYGALYKYGGFC